jgi:TPR repeat protein
MIYKVIFTILAVLAVFASWQFELKEQDESKDEQVLPVGNYSLSKPPVREEDPVDLLDECKKGNIGACNEGWDAYYNFDDVEKAVEFAKIACEHGDMSSCTTVGNAYEYAYKLLKYDPKQAYDYYKRACDGGNKNGCERLKVFSFDGKKVKHDTSQRVKELQAQCYSNHEDSPSSCTDLGIMYEKGMGLKKDYKMADKFYSLGCKAVIDRGCEEGTRLDMGEYYE